MENKDPNFSIYPIRFNVCPNCGSPRRIIEEEVNVEIGAKHLAVGSRVPAMVSQSVLADPNNKSALIAKRPVPVMIGYFDVCVECGTLYCVEMNKMTAMLDPQIRQGPGQPGQPGQPGGDGAGGGGGFPPNKMPPFFGKG